jgi:hypothetical protein
MGQTERFDRDSTLFVARGLYILRYETGPDGYVAPTAFVAPASGFENMIEIIGPPGVPNGRLEGPGAVLFMRASDNASLRVGVKRKSAGGSLEAALKLESVGGLQPGVSLQADGTTTLKEAPGEAGSDILFVAHVARRGDVSVRPCEWVAGPDSPAAIEGLEMCTSGFDGVCLEMQVLSASPSGAWSGWVKPGTFVGTRGRNLPLVGLRLRLTGETGRRYLIIADALFLGSAIANRRGQEVEFLSSAGRDPLVGFRLDIRPERRLSIWQAARPAGIDVERRVRVFKAAAG